MDAAELPDDCKRWPSDPFAVLGIARGAADTDIKRAYNRLLRRFKPEQSPVQFQRLRECYETCLEQSPWYRHREDDGGAEPPFILDLPREAPADPLGDFWKAAIEGRTAVAYSGLVEAHRMFPDRGDVPLRLYWLLAVSPELDTVRTRHDWLLIGLQSSRLGGTAAELYRRELEADHSGALGGVYSNLLGTPANTTDLQRIAGLRIAAAARVCAGKRLYDDLQRLRERRMEIGDEAWLALLVQTVAWTAWGGWPMVGDVVRLELKSLEYLQLHHSYAFDRIDESRVAGEAAKRLAELGLAPVQALVRIDWASHDAPTEPEIRAAATCLAENLGDHLASLGRLSTEFGPGVVATVGRIFSQHVEDGDEGDFPLDVARAVGHRIGHLLNIAKYQVRRPAVIAALAEEGIDPRDFAIALSDDNKGSFRDFAERLRDDLLFRIGWLAVRIACAE